MSLNAGTVPVSLISTVQPFVTFSISRNRPASKSRRPGVLIGGADVGDLNRTA